MTHMEKVILTAFTDPMMGLSYESEPIMGCLQKEYGDVIEFRNVMGLLARDVSDFMTTEERSLKPEEGISLYCIRLAQIYKSEESIGKLPINIVNRFRRHPNQHKNLGLQRLSNASIRFV